MSAPMDDEVEIPDTTDYYACLGLNKEASNEDINNSFRRLSKIFHPDKHARFPDKKANAENIFTHIKKAHEVLSDPHKRAIYDTMGMKGLETEGWQIVSRTKTPQEIREEYERLMQEREERRLEQRTNPRGTVSVGINATDVFERYDTMGDYRPGMPQVELTGMSISQSVEAPLTSSNTAVLAGNLSTQNGNGTGSITATLRRVMSYRSWAEVEVSAGNGASFALRGFRTLWARGFGTMAGTLQFTPRGIRPGFTTMVATQLDRNLQGRITWNTGAHSSMNTSIVWDNQAHHVLLSLQLGMPNSFVTLNYSYKFTDHDAKIKATLRMGTFGTILEYGAEKKVSKFSILGASMVIGIPTGITLKIKLNRGNQIYLFPIQLADSIVPSAIFYGTVLPILGYMTINVLIVSPFLKNQKEKETQKKKERHAEVIAQRKRDAEAAVELMKESVRRIRQTEEDKGGLVILEALYGKLVAGPSDSSEMSESECIDVAAPLQALVKDSVLEIGEGAVMSDLPGFYDPCLDENKCLRIKYLFRKQHHECTFNDKDMVKLPRREHLCTESGPSVNT